MRLSRRTTVLALLLLAVASSSGCVGNMEELKSALGFGEAPPPEPTYEPPVAKAQANATSAVVGVPVRFTSEGTRDPQGLALTLRWSFGDFATADGPEATHAWTTPGDYLVKLNVTNAAGLSDEETLSLKILSADEPPVAAFRVLDAQGVVVSKAEKDATLTFDGTASADPEGGPLAHEWDFGDGATSHDATPTHAYAKPGLYTVRLTVADRGGQTSEASRLVAVDASWTFAGAFAATDGERKAFTFDVAEGATLLNVTLTFPGGAGVNDLAFVVKDAAGAEVARSTGETQPGAQGSETRAAALAGEALRAAKAGAWTVEVVKAKGVQVDFTLSVRETF